MYIENERNPELFWLNTIRNDLKRHNQVLTSFCSILAYYINELNKTYDVILQTHLSANPYMSLPCPCIVLIRKQMIMIM